jgi:hypothetical protein
MGHFRHGVAALLFIGAPAYAQSLDNGEPLRFNHTYHCNNERLIIGNCRDSDPASYCQVSYPDRTPAHPGYIVTKAEKLGYLLQTLSACSGAGLANPSGPHPAPAPRSMRAQSSEATEERAPRGRTSRDGRAYLSCVINDPAWPPPLTIIIDEPANEVRVAGASASGTSPNPKFNPTTVVFGFAGRQFTVDRTNLSLMTEDLSFFGQTYHGTCRFGAPPKRAF